HNRGFVYHEQGDYTLAIADYDQVIRLDPENADAYYNRGLAYHASGAYAEAVADYTQAITLNPEDVEAYYNRGMIYFAQAEYQLAVADFTLALSVDPAYTEAYHTRGVAYEILDKTEFAAGDFAAYIEQAKPEVVEGAPLSFSQTVTLEIGAGTVYLLRFRAETQQVIDIIASAPNTSVDPLIVLLDPDENPIAGSDDQEPNSENYSAAIEGFVVPQAGLYTLLVTTVSGTEGAVEVTASISGG